MFLLILVEYLAIISGCYISFPSIVLWFFLLRLNIINFHCWMFIIVFCNRNKSPLSFNTDGKRSLKLISPETIKEGNREKWKSNNNKIRLTTPRKCAISTSQSSLYRVGSKFVMHPLSTWPRKCHGEFKIWRGEKRKGKKQNKTKQNIRKRKIRNFRWNSNFVDKYIHDCNKCLL